MKSMVFVVIITIIFPQVVGAAWIDDWIQQKTVVSPNYLNGQKRGYATLGGFSARWNSSNDYLLSINKPRLKSGCGGIDLFLGGASFLNADYLVQKLQNMINAAPAIAFDIALNTLSSQVAKSLSKFEAIVDRLNQLQLDDCKATKAVVSEIAGGLSSKESVQSYKTHAVQDFLQSSGVSSLYDEITRKSGDNTVAGAMSTVGGTSQNSLVAGCPNTIKNVFFSTGSILVRLLGNLGLPNNGALYADMMRGFIGDVAVDGTNLNYKYIQACPKNSPDNFDGFLNGDVWAKPFNGQCQKITSINVSGVAYTSVRDWIFKTLVSICNKMISRTALTPIETSFLTVIPTPVYRSMIVDIAAQGMSANGAGIASTYTDIVASAYAYAMLSDLYDTIHAAIETGNVIVANTNGAQLTTNQNKCHLELAKPAISELEKMENKMPDYIRAARQQYMAKFAIINTSASYNNRIVEVNGLIKSALSEHFAPGLASREVK